MDNLLSASVRYLFVFFFVQSKKNSEAIKKKEKKKVRVVIVLLFPRAGKLHRCPYQWINNCSLASSTFLRPRFLRSSPVMTGQQSTLFIGSYTVCVCRDLWRRGTKMSFFQCCASHELLFFFPPYRLDLFGSRERERERWTAYYDDWYNVLQKISPPPSYFSKKEILAVLIIQHNIYQPLTDPVRGSSPIWGSTLILDPRLFLCVHII
jgi:hypothetical protein